MDNNFKFKTRYVSIVQRSSSLVNSFTSSVELIPSPRINKSDIFTCFELINGTMIRHLKDRNLKGRVVAELSHLANSYVLAHRPTVADLNKYKVLKDLKETLIS